MSKTVKQEHIPLESIELSSSIAHDVMVLGHVAVDFAAIERVPRYDCHSRENDAEHSFMLALVAGELAASYFPDLDTGLVSRFSIVHDLIELETGDVATYDLDEDALLHKEAHEHAALDRLTSQLPAATGRLLVRYEAQTEPEARFTRLVDKLLPVAIDIIGPGSQVMEEDYGIYTQSALKMTEDRLANSLRRRFPEPSLTALHVARDSLAAAFTATFQAG